jgi:sulfite reductase alpha subunit-like flavoprotein
MVDAPLSMADALKQAAPLPSCTFELAYADQSVAKDAEGNPPKKLSAAFSALTRMPRNFSEPSLSTLGEQCSSSPTASTVQEMRSVDDTGVEEAPHSAPHEPYHARLLSARYLTQCSVVENDAQDLSNGSTDAASKRSVQPEAECMDANGGERELNEGERGPSTPDGERMVLNLEFSLYDSGIEYKPGDSISFMCPNDEAAVESVLSRVQYDRRGVSDAAAQGGSAESSSSRCVHKPNP